MKKMLSILSVAKVFPEWVIEMNISNSVCATTILISMLRTQAQVCCLVSLYISISEYFSCFIHTHLPHLPCLPHLLHLLHLPGFPHLPHPPYPLRLLLLIRLPCHPICPRLRCALCHSIANQCSHSRKRGYRLWYVTGHVLIHSLNNVEPNLTAQLDKSNVNHDSAHLHLTRTLMNAEIGHKSYVSDLLHF